MPLWELFGVMKSGIPAYDMKWAKSINATLRKAHASITEAAGLRLSCICQPVTKTIVADTTAKTSTRVW